MPYRANSISPTRKGAASGFIKFFERVDKEAAEKDPHHNITQPMERLKTGAGAAQH